MRAYLLEKFGGPDQVKLSDLPTPRPGAGELLVEVFAAAFNPADIKVSSGSFSGRALHAGNFPMPLGYDFSGVVISAGEGASGHKPGDEVFGFLPYSRQNRRGTFADFVCVGAKTVGKKPASLSHAQAAAAATSGLSALQGLRDDARLQSGQSMLINGASGGVGTYAVQIGKLLGAQVSGLASAAKAELVKGFGADQVYDYAATSIAQLPDSFDAIFDVAANAPWGASSKKLKPGGAFVVTLPTAGFFAGKLASLFGAKRYVFLTVAPVAADLDQLSAWFDEGKLKPVLDETLPFADLKKGLERVRAGQVRSKIAVSMKE